MQNIIMNALWSFTIRCHYEARKFRVVRFCNRTALKCCNLDILQKGNWVRTPITRNPLFTARCSIIHYARSGLIRSDEGSPDFLRNYAIFTGPQQSESVMSQLSKVKRSRDQWKAKAKARGDHNRYQRKQLARIRAERDQATQTLKRTQGRLDQLERQRSVLPAPPKADLVWMALQLVLVACISFRATSRVLRLLAPALGLTKGPCAQTVINWVIRLTIVRLSTLR